MSTPLPSLREVIETYGLRTKKTLGQHFLLDSNLLAKIVRSAGDISQHHVIEVGPGPGGLTRAILAAAPRSVVAVEKDRRCMEALRMLPAYFSCPFEVQEADALEMDLRTLTPAPRVIIANLPYNIGTELVVRWIQAIATHGASVLDGFTVMLQKEVAQRMVASVGDAAYGRLAILTRQYCDAALLFDVPREAFYPPPNVTSAILRAKTLPHPREDVPLAALERVTSAAFNQRRKMLRQSLKSLGSDAALLCERAGIDPTLRAEQCDLAMFARLARAL